MTGTPFNKYCSACHGQFHNKPVVGMTFMWGGVETAPGHWTHLKVLDPRSGKIYKGYMTLMDHGKRAKLRGYIGIPLLGRTQVWYKTICPIR